MVRSRKFCLSVALCLLPAFLVACDRAAPPDQAAPLPEVASALEPAPAEGSLPVPAGSSENPPAEHGSDPAPGEGGEQAPHKGHEDEHGHDHSHDHDEAYESAGGAAHVHGLAELALVAEPGRLTGEMISPLANFSLSEAEGVFTPEVLAALPGMIVLTGGGCAAQEPVARIDTSSGHTDAHILFSWTCQDPAAVRSVRFDGFGIFPAFETLNVVFIGEAEQKAAALTPSAAEFSLR
jgi:hypothetical protein